MNQTGIIFDIKRYAIHDGPGIRTTVFFKGCPLDCWWCHNPESQQLEPQTVARRQPADAPHSLPEKTEIFGRRYTIPKVIDEIMKDVIFYDQSGGGVTFSGGEPLMQPEFLKEVLRACREQDIHTALDTSGYAPWESIEPLIDLVDLFLYDLKLIDDQAHMKYTGVSNMTVLNNLSALSRRSDNIRIRVPLIPDITDTEENLDAIVSFLRPLDSIRAISLLPYNQFGHDKFKRLNMINRLGDLKSQSSVEITDMSQHFHACGYQVKIGG